MQQAGTSKISFSLDEVPKLKDQAARGRPYADRISIGMALRMLLNMPTEIPHILDAIDVLEGLSAARNLKEAEPFRRPPLQGLWHQHFFSSSYHMMRNVGERWNAAGGGNFEYTRMVGEVMRALSHDPDALPMALARRFMDGYVERAQAGKLTGDWIVFAVHEGTRYYLDIALHEEGRGSNAPRLLAKLRASATMDFPFVFEGRAGGGDEQQAV